MAEQIGHEPRRRSAVMRVFLEIGLPALAFFLGIGFATRNWSASLITGLAVSSMIYAFYWLDRRFLHPHLGKLSQDWVRLGLEMTLTLFEHIAGALLALWIFGRLFRFEIVPSWVWFPVAGMVVAFPIIHGTEMALRYFRQLREKERQEGQLRALATEAELKALKAQINPHFLFNTLNTIAQLIHTDSDKAEETVERLAEMFRYVLNGSERRSVPLEEALSFLDSYLEIEKNRFGDRLRVTREVDPATLKVPVPSLILQPVVENAIRHGRGCDGSVDLTVRIQPHGDEVVIAIADRGPGMAAPDELGESPGHGLRNVDERLRKTYGATYGLEIINNAPKGTVVLISIPVGGEV